MGWAAWAFLSIVLVLIFLALRKLHLQRQKFLDISSVLLLLIGATITTSITQWNSSSRSRKVEDISNSRLRSNLVRELRRAYATLEDPFRSVWVISGDTVRVSAANSLPSAYLRKAIESSQFDSVSTAAMQELFNDIEVFNRTVSKASDYFYGGPPGGSTESMSQWEENTKQKCRSIDRTKFVIRYRIFALFYEEGFPFDGYEYSGHHIDIVPEPEGARLLMGNRDETP